MSNNMALVPVRDTAPERALRDALARLGVLSPEFNVAKLPGRPDVVIPQQRVAAFANGCFWHNHQGCRHGRVPNTGYPWRLKFHRTRVRDAETRATLLARGWRVLTVWECALLGAEAWSRKQFDEAIAAFLGGTEPSLEMEGRGVLRIVAQADAA
jgi:DNA mismatch endonuclease (patch repair protein)